MKRLYLEIRRLQTDVSIDLVHEDGTGVEGWTRLNWRDFRELRAGSFPCEEFRLAV